MQREKSLIYNGTPKTLVFSRLQRYVCVSLSKPASVQLQIPICAVYSLNMTHNTRIYT